MFFIRTTLLLGLGVLVLPTDQDSQARVLDRVKTATHWTVTFCDRNPTTCVEGQKAWGVFVKKAEFGLKMAVDVINDRTTKTENTTAQSAVVRATATSRGTTQTLLPTDLDPAGVGRPHAATTPRPRA